MRTMKIYKFILPILLGAIWKTIAKDATSTHLPNQRPTKLNQKHQIGQLVAITTTETERRSIEITTSTSAITPATIGSPDCLGDFEHFA